MPVDFSASDAFSPRRQAPRRSTAAIAACAAFAALMTGVAVNALFMQTERHPAPLFVEATPAQASPSTQLREASATRTPEPAGRPAAAPAPAAPQRQVRDVGLPPAPAAAPARAQQHRAEAPAAPRAEAPRPEATRPVPPRRSDEIGALLRAEGAAARPEAAPRNEGATGSIPRLAMAQRALGKAGFDLKIDGKPGPSTRAAIEAFERNNGLPVTGELNARTVRKLSVVSGVAIQ